MLDAANAEYETDDEPEEPQPSVKAASASHSPNCSSDSTIRAATQRGPGLTAHTGVTAGGGLQLRGRRLGPWMLSRIPMLRPFRAEVSSRESDADVSDDQAPSEASSEAGPAHRQRRHSSSGGGSSQQQKGAQRGLGSQTA